MKFYIEAASNKVIDQVEGFTLKHEPFQWTANPLDATVYTTDIYTVELDSMDELLKFVETTGGNVVVEWESKYPPKDRQHLPVLRIVDDIL